MANQNNNNKQFYALSAEIMERTDLSSDEKILYQVLGGFLNNQNSITYSDESLRKKLGWSNTRKVQRIIQTLENKQYIKREGCTTRRKIVRGDKYISAYDKNVISNNQPNEQELNSYDKYDISLRQNHTELKTNMSQTYDKYDVQYKEVNKENNNNNNSTPYLDNTMPPQPDPNPVVISSLFDKKLLNAKSKLPATLKPECNDHEFLEWCDYKLKQRRKEDIPDEQIINGLIKLMRQQLFTKPEGYKSQEELRVIEEQNKKRLEAIERASIERFKPMPRVCTGNNRKSVGELLKELKGSFTI